MNAREMFQAAVPAVAGFPLLGEAHPLRQRYTTMLLRAFCLAALLHLTGFTIFLATRSRDSAPGGRGRIVKLQHLSPPPSITQGRTSVDLRLVIQRTIGAPVPVPDILVPDGLMAENRDMVDIISALQPTELEWGKEDTLVIEMPAQAEQTAEAPEDFTRVEEMPSLITFPPPVYPTLARQAEVEGTVRLRLLVGKDGKVQDVVLLAGVEMLNDAAVDAARQAVFRPALQQHRPVAVWVEVPVRFRLHD